MVKVKKGDTLIEVMLAIGIFSMIAIAITAVMSSGSTGAQTALETTLAREEIDTQAEAIRFIQTSYAVDKDAADKTYANLWKEITKKAADLNNSAVREAVFQYSPASCDELYSESYALHDYAFVINPRALSTFSDDGSQSAVVRMNGNTGPNRIFHQTSTYPRLVFGNAITGESDNSGSLLDNNGNDLLFAEGLYVIAVKDDGTTDVIDVAGKKKNSGFYDFYIRSCWYGSDAEEPTTISTVIRLYDPDAITTAGFVQVSFANDAMTRGTALASGDLEPKEGRKVTLPTVHPRTGWTFAWKDDAKNKTFESGEVITNETPGIVSYTLRGEWIHTEYKINYNVSYPGGYSPDSPVSIPRQICHHDQNCRINEGTNLIASGWKFKGWCKGTAYLEGIEGKCNGTFFSPGQTINNGASPDPAFPNYFNRVEGERIMNLVPVWSMFDKTYRVILDWGDTRDLDTHVHGQKSNGDPFDSFFGETAISERFAGLDEPVDLAKLTSGDCTGRYSTYGCAQETFTLHTLGGKNYYYFVHAWRSSENFANATVTLQEKNADDTWRTINTWAANDATGSGRFWNVFALKDGAVVTRQTLSDGNSGTRPYMSYDIDY